MVNKKLKEEKKMVTEERLAELVEELRRFNSNLEEIKSMMAKVVSEREAEFAGKPVLKVAEVAKLLNINENLAYELVKRRDFPARQLSANGSIRVLRDAVLDWMREPDPSSWRQNGFRSAR